jgi:ATP/maltotriose-dependent transcriptional regulator MalT
LFCVSLDEQGKWFRYHHLFIAPATVKRHTENIYKKLDVPGRHQAVGKAQELAINLS